ncbi:MAG: CDGSH iron-sulfur domain-containing protein [Chitinophagaceae bacterium]
MKVEGDFETVGKEEKCFMILEEGIVSICGWGLSENKPFCDAPH